MDPKSLQRLRRSVPHVKWKLRPRRHVELGPNASYSAHQPDEPVDLRPCLRIQSACVSDRPSSQDQRIRPIPHGVPKLLSDERHEWVKHDEDLVEHPGRDFPTLGIDRSPLLAAGNGLDQLQIPVAKAGPDKMVDRVGALVETQLGKGDVERLDRLHRFADDPSVDGEIGDRRLDRLRGADIVGLAEARGVPQLGREVAITFDPFFIELDVPPLAFHRGQSESQGIGAVTVDDPERIDRIAFRLRHLLALGVANQAVEIERLPGPLPHEMIALHRHSGVPEEDDVEA